MSDSFDVLGIGCAAVDDFLFVDKFPEPDDKTPVRASERQCGGLTATALVAASRFGAKCAYAAVLGTDELSEFVASTLRHEKIDLNHVVYRPEARPIHSTIVVGAAGHTRNILYEIGGLSGADDSLPDSELIRSARVLFVDHYGIDGIIRAARIARKANVPVVADLERDDVVRFDELLDLVDHLIVSERFAGKITGAASPLKSALALWNDGRQVVIVTAGADGSWCKSRESADPQHCPAFAVSVVDSTGCGDVFHGVYAAELAAGAPLKERICRASAAAAIKATKAGGQAGIPKRRDVEAFLRRR